MQPSDYPEVHSLEAFAAFLRVDNVADHALLAGALAQGDVLASPLPRQRKFLSISVPVALGLVFGRCRCSLCCCCAPLLQGQVMVCSNSFLA